MEYIRMYYSMFLLSIHANPICFTFIKIISVGVKFVGSIVNKCSRS